MGLEALWLVWPWFRGLWCFLVFFLWIAESVYFISSVFWPRPVGRGPLGVVEVVLFVWWKFLRVLLLLWLFLCWVSHVVLCLRRFLEVLFVLGSFWACFCLVVFLCVLVLCCSLLICEVRTTVLICICVCGFIFVGVWCGQITLLCVWIIRWPGLFLVCGRIRLMVFLVGFLVYMKGMVFIVYFRSCGFIMLCNISIFFIV